MARRGFSLTEVLIAMGILALGAIAVASLFPAAAVLQKEAVKETMRQNHIRSTDAILEGYGLDNITLLHFTDFIAFDAASDPPTTPAGEVRKDENITSPAFDVFALGEVDLTVEGRYSDPSVTPPADTEETPDMVVDGDYSTYTDPEDSYLLEKYPVAVRSLPSSTPADEDGSYENREIFWVPLVRRGLEAGQSFADWSVYMFVLQPDSDLKEAGVYAIGNYGDFNGLVCANPADEAYFPKVFRVPVSDWDEADPLIAPTDVNLYGYVKPGDMVLGDNGVIYRVAQVDADTGHLALDEQTIYAPLNQRDLKAVWVAPAPGNSDEGVLPIEQDSPLAGIRLMSNTVVSTDDY